MIYQIQIYVFNKAITHYKQNISVGRFTPFRVYIHPNMIWKYISRPLYHDRFIVLRTNARSYPNYYWLYDH